MRTNGTCLVILALWASVAAADPVPKYAVIKDAAKQKQANQLNTEGYVFHTKKDFPKAEAKYLAALAADPGHVLARYNLACVYNLTNQLDKGLALLVELEKVEGCTACGDAVQHSRFDNDWKTAWDKDAYQKVVNAMGSDNGVHIDENGKLSCPAGTKQTGKFDGGEGKTWCQKGGVEHGPYIETEMGYDMGEGTRTESGQYVNGVKYGLWSHSETYGESFFGAIVGGKEHGFYAHFHKEDEWFDVYVNGVRQGATRTFDVSTGKQTFEATYVDGKFQGPSKEWDHEAGFLKAEGSYDKGKKHGRWIEYDADKRMSSDGTYDHDKRVGHWITRSEGKTSTDEEWDDKGKYHGTVYTYDAGVKASVGHYDHGVRHGVFEYYAKGKTVGTTTMDHGTGDWIAYAVDGTLREKGKIAKTGKEGAWWEETSAGSYAAGKETGPWVIYLDFAHKTKRSAGSYTAGKKTGVWEYFDGTKTSAKGKYVNDIPDGEWVIDEVESQTVEFRGGKIVKLDGRKPTKWELCDYSINQWPQFIRSAEGNPMATCR